MVLSREVCQMLPSGMCEQYTVNLQRLNPAPERNLLIDLGEPEPKPADRPLNLASVPTSARSRLKCQVFVSQLKQIVYHSVFKAESFRDVPHFASKLAIESALREFDVPFTIIRPNYFFQNDELLKEPLTKAGVYPVPLGLRGISAVDIRDIAEAAAIALTSEGILGKPTT